MFDRFDTFPGERQVVQILWRGVAQPQAPALQAIDEFFRAKPRAEKACGRRFLCDEGIALGGVEQIIAVINRLVANAAFRYAAEWHAPRGQHDVWCIHQIRVDLPGSFFQHLSAGVAFAVGVAVVKQAFRLYFFHPVFQAEADDDAMHGGFAAGIIAPFEGAVGKFDGDVLCQQPAPQHAHLLALGDAVSGNKGHLDFFPCGGVLRFGQGKQVVQCGRGGGGFVQNAGLFGLGKSHILEFLFALIGLGGTGGIEILRGLDVPGGDKIQHAAAVYARPGQQGVHAFALGGVNQLAADKGRVAENVVQLGRGTQLRPVQIEGVAVADAGGLFQRQLRQPGGQGFAQQDVHLVIDQPHGDLRHLRREFFDFDAAELGHVNPHGAEGFQQMQAAQALRAMRGQAFDGVENVDFQLPQFAVSNDQKIAAAAGRIEKTQAV